MNQPGTPSAAVLAEETGIKATMIYGWKQNSRRKTFLAAAEPLGGRGRIHTAVDVLVGQCNGL